MVAGRTYGLAEGALEDFDPRIEFLSRVSTERRDNIDRGILSVVRLSSFCIVSKYLKISLKSLQHMVGPSL